MSSQNYIIKRVRKDLEMLRQLQAENEVDFNIRYPIIRKKHGYITTEFQRVWLNFCNEKAREAV